MEVTLFGVSALALIIAIVEVLKRQGMPVRFAPLVALFLAVAAETIAHVARVYPESAAVLESVVRAVVLWLLTTGAYERVAKPAIEAVVTSRRERVEALE